MTKTSAALTRTHALSPAFTVEVVAKISMMFIIKQSLCQIFSTPTNPLAFERI